MWGKDARRLWLPRLIFITSIASAYLAVLAVLFVIDVRKPFPHSELTPLDRTLSETASELVGHKVRIYCSRSFPEWKDFLAERAPVLRGMARSSSRMAALSPEMCHGLEGVLRTAGSLEAEDCDEGCGRSDKYSPELMAAGVYVLAHEIIHLRGTHVEGTASCRGLLLSPLLARKLGSTEFFAKITPRLAYQFTHATEPPIYHIRCSRLLRQRHGYANKLFHYFGHRVIFNPRAEVFTEPAPQNPVRSGSFPDKKPPVDETPPSFFERWIPRHD